MRNPSPVNTFRLEASEGYWLVKGWPLALSHGINTVTAQPDRITSNVPTQKSDLEKEDVDDDGGVIMTTMGVRVEG